MECVAVGTESSNFGPIPLRTPLGNSAQRPVRTDKARELLVMQMEEEKRALERQLAMQMSMTDSISKALHLRHSTPVRDHSLNQRDRVDQTLTYSQLRSQFR